MPPLEHDSRDSSGLSSVIQTQNLLQQQNIDPEKPRLVLFRGKL